MAAGDIKVHRTFLANQITGAAVVDFDTDTIKLMLLGSGHTPSSTGDDYAKSLTANQVTAGTAYTDGGPELVAKSITVSGSFAIWKAGTLTVTQDSAGGFAAARWGLIYKAGTSMGDSPVIATLDLGTDRNNTAGPLVISPAVNKIIKWQY